MRPRIFSILLITGLFFQAHFVHAQVLSIPTVEITTCDGLNNAPKTPTTNYVINVVLKCTSINADVGLGTLTFGPNGGLDVQGEIHINAGQVNSTHLSNGNGNATINGSTTIIRAPAIITTPPTTITPITSSSPRIYTPPTTITPIFTPPS